MDDAAAFLELPGDTKAVLHRGECFHVAHQSPCIRLRNDSIDNHLEAGEAFARMSVLSKENDRNVRHYLLQFSRCLQAIQYGHCEIENYQIGTVMQREF